MTVTTISRTAVARLASGANPWVACTIALVLALSVCTALAFGAIIDRLWTVDVSVAAQNADDRTNRRPFEHTLGSRGQKPCGGDHSVSLASRRPLV
jgi:hypothetical protein